MGNKSAAQNGMDSDSLEETSKMELLRKIIGFLLVTTNLGIIAISPVERDLCKLKIICSR